MSAELPAPPAGHRWKLSKVTGDDHLGLRPFLVLKLQRRNRLVLWSTVRERACVVIHNGIPANRDPADTAKDILARFHKAQDERRVAEGWFSQYGKTQDA